MTSEMDTGVLGKRFGLGSNGLLKRVFESADTMPIP